MNTFKVKFGEPIPLPWEDNVFYGVPWDTVPIDEDFGLAPVNKRIEEAKATGQTEIPRPFIKKRRIIVGGVIAGNGGWRVITDEPTDMLSMTADLFLGVQHPSLRIRKRQDTRGGRKAWVDKKYGRGRRIYIHLLNHEKDGAAAGFEVLDDAIKTGWGEGSEVSVLVSGWECGMWRSASTFQYSRDRAWLRTMLQPLLPEKYKYKPLSGGWTEIYKDDLPNLQKDLLDSWPHRPDRACPLVLPDRIVVYNCKSGRTIDEINF